jgi:tetratricopeptide (TPR) repeat protein
MISSGYSVTLAKTAGGQFWTKNFPYSITSAQIAPDGTMVLVGAEEGTATALDGGRNKIWEFEGTDPISAIAISGPPHVSILGTRGGMIHALGPQAERLWEAASEGPVVDCAVDSEGKLITVARTKPNGTGCIEIYNANGTPILDYSSPNGITSIACSPDGRFVAVSTEDGTLRILEVVLSNADTESDEQASGLYTSGCSMMEAKDYSSAIAKFTELLQTSPIHVDACRRLVEAQDAFIKECLADVDAAASSGSPDQAVSKLQTALQIRPYDRGIFDRMIAMRAQFITEISARTLSLAENGDIEPAIEKTKQILEIDFTNIQAREQLAGLEKTLALRCSADAGLALSEDRAADAIALLERAVTLDPSPEFQTQLVKAKSKQAFSEGLALYNQKRYPQAQAQFRRAVSLDSENAEAVKYLEYSESLRQDDPLFDRFSRLE